MQLCIDICHHRHYESELSSLVCIVVRVNDTIDDNYQCIVVCALIGHVHRRGQYSPSV
jgi:hypothetical protein